MKPRPTHPLSAFSLIEVMVAVAILAVALVGLTHGLSTAIQSSRDSSLHSQAVWIAAGQIEELRADLILEPGETEGVSGNFTWTRSITRTDTDGLFEIRVAVSRSSESGTLYTLTTLLFDPPIPGSDPEQERKRRQERQRKGASA